MKKRVIVSCVLFALAFILEKCGEKVFPFKELVDLVLPKKA